MRKSFRNSDGKDGEVTRESIEQKAAEYSKKSESELMDELIGRYAEQKEKGEIDGEKLNALAKNVAGFLNETQKEKLFGLVEMLSKK